MSRCRGLNTLRWRRRIGRSVCLCLSPKAQRIRDKPAALQVDILIGDVCQLIASFSEIKRHEQVVLFVAN